MPRTVAGYKRRGCNPLCMNGLGSKNSFLKVNYLEFHMLFPTEML